MNHFRCLMNFSCLVWQQLQVDSQVKLQANNKMYAFPSFFVLSLYPIKPAKSRPITLKGVDPCVLSVGNFPAGGFEKALTWNFLHPLHPLITLFVSCTIPIVPVQLKHNLLSDKYLNYPVGYPFNLVTVN